MNRNNVLKIITIIVIIANILLVIDKFVYPWVNNYNMKKQYEKELEEIRKNSTDEVQEVKEEEQEEFVYNEYNDLILKGEQERMRHYIGKYISFINDKNYVEAYNLLYDNFKNEKFPTLESFEEYAKNKYYDNIYISYNDMRKYATYALYSVSIGDFSDIGNEDKFIDTVFIIKENDIADFKLSFGM